MTACRTFLLGLWVCITGYTAIVISNHGLGLFPIFFGDIARMGWPGQFNLDFMTLLRSRGSGSPGGASELPPGERAGGEEGLDGAHGSAGTAPSSRTGGRPFPDRARLEA